MTAARRLGELLLAWILDIGSFHQEFDTWVWVARGLSGKTVVPVGAGGGKRTGTEGTDVLHGCTPDGTR